MRAILRTLVLSSFLSVPLAATAHVPQEGAADPCGRHAQAGCDCALGDAAQKTARGGDAAPSDFVRNIWTSP